MVEIVRFRMESAYLNTTAHSLKHIGSERNIRAEHVLRHDRIVGKFPVPAQPVEPLREKAELPRDPLGCHLSADGCLTGM